MDIKEKVKKLPDSCGVYIMKSAGGRILYVGKAVSLKKRVSSYFSSTCRNKNKLLVDKVKKIDFIECQSPQQALILEAALIKEKNPRYNVRLKDSKSYPYLEITREKYPRVFVSRPRAKKNSYFFGPYTDAGSLRKALADIRRVFPFCSCRRRRKKLCLYYYIGLCPGPCAGKTILSAYSGNIKAIKKIFSGRRRQLLSSCRRKMRELSSRQKFEAAARIRDKIYAVENIYKGPPKLHELTALKKGLNLPVLPLLIEAIDISSLGKDDSVGSLVVFKAGKADKSGYRRFLIKSVSGIDDYKKIEEVVWRRYSRLVGEKRKLPDLILVDGGIGQVGSAAKVLKRLEAKIPLAGLAKKNEEVWLPGESRPRLFAKSSPALRLLQRVRDEAHRFAHSYHLLRRKKSRIKKTARKLNKKKRK